MSNRIERIDLDGFRGATTPITILLDPNRPMVVIFGDNGTGKSTILDAIDMVCNGAVGSLSDRSLGANPARYLPAAGSEGGRLHVGILAGESASSASLAPGRGGVRRNGAIPAAHVLRRKKMLNLV